jgi:hypothetical protein
MNVTIRIVMTSVGPIVAARIEPAPSARELAVDAARRARVIEVAS